MAAVLVLMDEDFYHNNELLSGARQARPACPPSNARTGRSCRRAEEAGTIALLAGFLASSYMMGMLFGVMSAWTTFGRKTPLLGAAVLGMTSSAVMWWSPTIWVLIGARLCCGYAGGVSFLQGESRRARARGCHSPRAKSPPPCPAASTQATVPLFLSECAPASRRGFVVSVSYFLTVMGVLCSYLVNFIVVVVGSDDWRLMLGLTIVPAFAMLVITATVPESPRWLASKQRVAEAHAVLQQLRKRSDVGEELRTIVNSLYTSTDGSEPADVLLDTVCAANGGAINADAPATETTALLASPSASKSALVQHGGVLVPTSTGPNFRILFTRKDALRAFLICVGLEFFQQYCGVQAVTTYTPTILKESGVAGLFVKVGLSEDASALLMTMIVYCCKVPFVYLGMVTVDRFGRRNILLLTLPIMSVALAGVAISFLLPDSTNAGAIVAVIATTVFGCSYSPGLGSVLSVIESEMFAPDIRSTGLATVGTLGTLFNISILLFYDAMATALGNEVVFGMFSIVSALATVYVYFVLPETKQQVIELSYKRVLTDARVNPDAAAK